MENKKRFINHQILSSLDDEEEVQCLEGGDKMGKNGDRIAPLMAIYDIGMGSSSNLWGTDLASAWRKIFWDSIGSIPFFLKNII